MELCEALSIVLIDGRINKMATRSLATEVRDPKKQEIWNAVRGALLRQLPPTFFGDDPLYWPEAIRAIQHGLTKKPTCIECGGKVKFFTGGGGNYATFCSPRCSSSNVEVQSKNRQTTMLNHGVPNAFMSETSKEKSRVVRNAIRQQTGKWPGSERPPEQRLITTRKIVATRKKNFTVGILTKTQIDKSKEVIAKLSADWSNAILGYNGRILQVAHKCGAIQINPRRKPENLMCFECEAPKKAQLQWDFEQELRKLSATESIIRNFRLPSKKQIDIYFPDRQLGIEINGLYWHSEAFKDQDPLYHQQKYLEARANGIRLITIWEDELRFKKDIVVGRLISILKPTKLNARSCELVQVSRANATAFLNEHHLSGSGAGTAVGLKFDDRLVMVATYGAVRFGKNRQGIELIRLATAGGIQIRGGLSRIIKKIRADTKLPLMSYASTDWGGGGYETIGGQVRGITKPGYFYFNKSSGTRHHRLGFSSKNFMKTTGIAYDKSLSEAENAAGCGFYRFFTGGSWIYDWV